jgi:putative acyl-CoA dehydrogenase
MAACLQGALLIGGDSPEVADLFCASRLGGSWRGTFGTLPAGPELGTLVRRTTPAV